MAALLFLFLVTMLLVAPSPDAGAAPEHKGRPGAGTRSSENGQPNRKQRPSRAAAREAAKVPDDPLRVSITHLSPKVLGPQGPIRVSGTVRNISNEAWSAINLHAFISPTPISTGLDEALALPADATVGTRITTPGTFDRVDRLEPGASARFQMTIAHQELGISGATGVYWFGVHALAQSDTEIRDEYADGRDRTLLPLVDRRAGAQVPATLVLPLQGRVDRDPDGRVQDLPRWYTLLAPGGRLDRLLRLTDSAETPITWMVDPAVLEAVEQISQGNPADRLQSVDTEEPEGEGSPGPDSTGSADPSGSSSTPDGPGTTGTEGPTGSTDETPAVDPALVQHASEWLAAITTRLRTTEVLSLPYGDLDLSAATQAASSLGQDARARSATALERFNISATPVLTGPDGHVRPATLDSDPDSIALLNSEEVQATGVGSVIQIHRRKVLLTNPVTAVTPDDSQDAADLRQRILAETALRQQSGGGEPLLMVLPGHWRPTRAAAFLRGLDQKWITWQSIAQMRAQPAVTVPDDALAYPRERADRELPSGNFTAAGTATARARLVGRLVDGPSQIGEAVTRSVLTQLGTDQRDRAERALDNVDAIRERMQSLVSQINVEAPNRVILSSDSGQFSSTITNGLEVPIRVRLRAHADGDLALSTPPTLNIPADSRRTVLLQARTSQTGVHVVTLSLTDVRGTALGQHTSVPVRAAQVSKIVWWLMLGGVLLLVVMSGRRLAQRWRRRRLVVPESTVGSERPDGREQL